MNRALAAATLAAAFAIPALPQASAQCDGDAAFCASVEVSGSVQIGRRRRRPAVVVVSPAPQPPPPPPVIVAPAPPQPRGRVIVVQPAPPAPPPAQVVVAPAPQPQPQETVVVIEQQPARYRLQVAPWTNRKVGLSARLGTMINDQVRMGGVQLGLRFRPSRIFAIELGVGGYGGTDYNGMNRGEVPVTFDAMFFLPRASRVQAYVLAGFGISYAHTEGFHEGYGREMERDMAYFGGQAGLGVEWRIAPRFALSTDLRAFLRTRVSDDDGVPEFYDPDTGNTSDTSVGAVGTLGAHFYF
ncbi:MAG: outer membrane beta-barrel protein [Sandaracinus sp.]|nr:outer membrane beta-barrel protein [Sandaracinus sp.]